MSAERLWCGVDVAAHGSSVLACSSSSDNSLGVSSPVRKSEDGLVPATSISVAKTVALPIFALGSETPVANEIVR